MLPGHVNRVHRKTSEIFWNCGSFPSAFPRFPQRAVAQMKELKTLKRENKLPFRVFIRNTCECHVI